VRGSMLIELDRKGEVRSNSTELERKENETLHLLI
jgi:hypothetical protein